MRKYLWNNGSFWDVRETAKGSWVWRKLLKLRPLAAQFIRMQVRNGINISLCSDYWLPQGRLIDLIGPNGPQRLGIGRCAMVADIANEAGWRFRRRRDQNLQQLITLITALPAPTDDSEEDKVLWCAGADTYASYFS